MNEKHIIKKKEEEEEDDDDENPENIIKFKLKHR
jgi:hypothetical protein